MADYDQPALWKYVLEQTGAEKITYMGHSQGTVQMFAAMCGSESDFFQDHMMRFVAIAPFVKLQNVSSALLKDMY